MLELDLDQLKSSIEQTPMFRKGGRLKSVTGVLTCTLRAALGDQCVIITEEGEELLTEVIGFQNDLSYLVPYDPITQAKPGNPVIWRGRGGTVGFGPSLLGRVIDGLGRPIDAKGPLTDLQNLPLAGRGPAAMERSPIVTPFITGIRAIDSMLTLGIGQRVGIFSGSGVGKSTLLSEIAKRGSSEVNVIALVGERGREVKPFIENSLGPEGMARSIVVVATAEQTPLMRVRATQYAIALADAFRSQSSNVLMMIDSLTRVALAQRELGQLLGEPPGPKGYTASVFQVLSNIVERLGNAETGGITALLTVLVDGGDLDEPIADFVRGVVDGHIVLDRGLAQKGHYPAISIAQSISRVAQEVTNKEHRDAARVVRRVLSLCSEVEDAVRIGLYKWGLNPQTDLALQLKREIDLFLQQDTGNASPFSVTHQQLTSLASKWKEP